MLCMTRMEESMKYFHLTAIGQNVSRDEITPQLKLGNT